MAANSSDHNYYSLGHRRHPSQQQSAYDPPAHDIDDDLQHTSTQGSSSSSYLYRQSTHLSPKRPVVATNFEQYVSDASLNGFTSEPPSINSPDPHEFYRQYRDSFISRREPNDIYGQTDLAAAGREDGMTTSRTSQRPAPTVVRTNGYASSTLASRVGARPGARPSVSPALDKGSLLSAKSHPQLTANTPRNRQTSLQDLVNRFNQTPDEVPPLPSTANSRSNSFSKGPTVGHSYRQPKSRTPSDSHQPSYGIPMRISSSSQSHSDKPSNVSYRRRFTNEDRDDNGATSKADKGRRTEPLITKNLQAAKSMIDLSPSPEQKFTRRPLFGEVLSVNPSHLDPGYGITTSRPRRGSEGSMQNSMHNPNPMFPHDSPIGSTKISPSSPTAWYLGVTPSLEGINLDKPIPARPPGMHRRSRSDFSGSHVTIPHSNSTTKPVAILSPPQEQPSPVINSPNTTKRNSQSRIPVSTRRTSITSDSSNSSPSTRANSAANNHWPPALKAISTLQKPKSYPKPSSPDGHSKSSPSRKSPKRRNLSPLRKAEQQPNSGSSSPSLKAYISAPMPLKSPPLRSSRPRQPVSTATTSASRARAVEHLKAKEGRNKGPEHKPRNLPELGGIDFAARRQRIQQAFTTKVQEQERKDEIEAERLRVTHLRESQYQDIAPPPEPQKHPSISSDYSEGLIYEDFQDHNEHYDTPAEETLLQDHDLAIHTNHQAQRSVLDLGQEDSPTLGNAYRFTSSSRPDPGSETPPSDIEEPQSAITTGTNDTFFDNEPQEESPIEHRTILTHVLALRESSPESSPTAQTFALVENGTTEKDDREEIQIMLGATPVVEKASEMDRGEAGDGTQDGDQPWRQPSWSSSVYSIERQSLDREREAPMERIDEHASTEQEDTTQNSLSTVSSTYSTQQPWSPESSASVVSPRTTLDAESYNPINKVLEHYHESDFLSPEVISDFQQRLSTQSPNLARAGGWDPKKVTQLYLQNLARTKYTQTNAVPEPLRLSVRTSPEVPPIPTVEEPTEEPLKTEEGHEPDLEERRTVDYIEYEEISNSEALEVERLNPQRASLNNPDDWASTSPSFLDWIHNHPTDTPIEENLPASRHWSDGNLEVRNHSTNQHSVGQFSLELPQIERTEGGLGIDIHVEPPHDRDSPILPSHFPQPSESHHSSISILPSTTYTRPPPSPPRRAPSVDPPAIPAPMVETNTRTSSIDSSYHTEPVAAPPSLPGSNSTSRSREQPSVENVPAAKEAPAKAPVTAEQKRLTRRRNIIKELVDTEHSFGQDMKVVDDIYKGTSNGLVISSEDVKVLFGNSDQIVAFSTAFLDALKQASRSVYVLPKSKRWRNKRDSTATSTSGFTDDQSSINGAEMGDDEKDRKTFIGDAFQANLSQMEKVYADYLKNHDAANQKLQSLQKNDKVQVWLKECRNYAHDLTTAWDLDSLLVKPVQRILKYPLLLKELLEVTPDNHPDFTNLDIAAREMVGVSKRINEMKKRADIIEQVAGSGRKRKDSDGRIGLTKAFGRRTEKLRQQVGLSDSIQDREYNNVSEKFGLHFFQLQVVMRDVEMYTTDVAVFVNRFNDFVLAIDAYIDVGQSTYPEVESKWRKFRMLMREVQMTALVDHVNAIRKNVIDPMTTLLKLHDGPQKLMQKRAKRVIDYARYKAMKERGDKPDKKTADQGEQFVAINETLKEELPKLFALTGKLVEACLNNFVQLQLQWQIVWRKKLSHAIDSQGVSNQLADIVSAFSGDFQYTEAQALSLGICNGSLLAETANLVNLLSPSTTVVNESSPRQSSSSTLDPRQRGLSTSSDVSPSIPPPDFGTGRQSDGLLPNYNPQAATGRRIRASSTASARSPATPEIPGGWRHYSNSSTPPTAASHPNRPSTSTGRGNDTPLLPRLSVDNPSAGPFNRLSADSQGIIRPPSTSGYGQREALTRPEEPARRYSGFFSSAMPMSDSPMTETPPHEAPRQREFNVLFLAASVYEFNIDRSRKEAGYPYLTYIAGEIFDVIGEKGELWLAKNQDDETCQVGWIWNKHFAKLAS